MTIVLNGEPVDCPDGQSIGALVDRLRPGGRRGVAVAVDGVVIRRADWDTTRIDDGAHVELVGAVQGG
ncbi:MAG TPA: sulfur carrier protein ThiS [Nitriliruptorales bacterium]